MLWDSVIGQEKIKLMLRDSIQWGRIPQVLLFTGKEGYGLFPIALAYAQEILEQESSSASKVERLNHVDLHFSFPTYTPSGGKALSENFYGDWKKMILESLYANQEDWKEKLDSQNKQLMISVHEVEEIMDRFRLKSFDGGYRILIMMGADKMKEDAANKLLKFLEEPPEKTLLILLAENPNSILPTILSRCQVQEIPGISVKDLQKALENSGVPENQASMLAIQSQGDWNLAMKMSSDVSHGSLFESFFVRWVRSAFQAKKKPEAIAEILFWARDVALWNREQQKSFITYCSETFRLALIQNYHVERLVYRSVKEERFKWDGFSTFIHGGNIELILKELSLADLHLLRNGNPKIIWADVGIKLTRYIHRAP